MIKLKNITVLLLLLYSCGDNVHENYTYHDNGKIESTTTIKDGVPDGSYFFYYDNGVLEEKGNYIDGLKQGTSITYYPSGKIKQETNFKDGEILFQRKYREDGSLRVESYLKENEIYFQRNFREDGSLDEESYYEDGKLKDVLFYKNDSIRDWGPNMIGPLFITKSDTVKLGETYETKIRLGNRMYPKTEVVIDGDTSKRTLTAPRLPKLDSVTSLYEAKAIKPGINTLKGVILDIKVDSLGNEIEWYTYTFNHEYYVIDSM